MRKPFVAFVSAGSLLLTGGIAYALETVGSPDAPSEVVTTATADDVPSDASSTPDGTALSDTESSDTESSDTASSDTASSDTEESDTEESDTEESDTESSESEHPDNHGSDVSAAAHSCPNGEEAKAAGTTHGECVREVARDNNGHADDDESADEVDDSDAVGGTESADEDDADEDDEHGRSAQHRADGATHGKGVKSGN